MDWYSGSARDVIDAVAKQIVDVAGNNPPMTMSPALYAAPDAEVQPTALF